MPTLAGASAYHVQVASDEQFDKIVRDLKIDGGNWAQTEFNKASPLQAIK